MTRFQTILSGLGGLAALYALAEGLLSGTPDILIMVASLVLLLAAARRFAGVMPHHQIDFGAGLVGMAALLMVLDAGMGADFWALLLASWLFSWLAVERAMMARAQAAAVAAALSLGVPVFFGIWIIFVWQLLTVGLEIPMILLPSPEQIAVRFFNSTSVLWADFQQTFVKAALTGYIMGCGSAFILAILIDRVPFLQRGLLPVGNFVSALPIIGIAPVMVMWFGFDWQSKAAVVVVMTFFPMLVNTLAGLQATQAMERDLLRTYASSYFQLLIKLRLPTAAPFIFNALKINSTLALIGAIVAEFFGTPIVGLGFRISTEVGRMNLDMVWAGIVVAALAGSLSYGLLGLLERQVTFWHPSNRRKQS